MRGIVNDDGINATRRGNGHDLVLESRTPTPGRPDESYRSQGNIGLVSTSNKKRPAMHAS